MLLRIILFKKVKNMKEADLDLQQDSKKSLLIHKDIKHCLMTVLIYLTWLNFPPIFETKITPNLNTRILSNNSHPSINCLPQIVTPLWWKYLKYTVIAPLPTPLAIFSFFKLKWKMLQQNSDNQWRSTLYKYIKEPNLEHFKSLCSVYLT